jgi:hypothetical protein
MQRLVVLACAALTVAMFASPLGAQQTPSQRIAPNEPVPRTEQSMPQVAQPPVSETQPLPPPPPFPPMPSARPSHRWVDIGDHRARRVHRHSPPTRHHARWTQHRRSAAHYRSARKARLAAHFSRRKIHSCHGMNYRQIMRHSSCRMMMRQELAAIAHRQHHATPHHRAAAHRHRARHHHAARQRKN